MHDVTDYAVRIENYSLPCKTENWYSSRNNKIVVDLLGNRAIFPLSFLKRIMDAMLLFILLEVASIFREAENLRLRYSRNEVIFDLHENRGILVISSSLLDENYG